MHLNALMTRIAALIEALRWSQAQMAQALFCDRTTVSRLVNGRPEQGIHSHVLDLLALALGLFHVTAAAFDASSPAPAAPEPAAAVDSGFFSEQHGAS